MTPKPDDQDDPRDHSECMCFNGERCRYHQALDRNEALAAEVTRLRQDVAEANKAYRDLYHDEYCGVVCRCDCD